MSSQPEHGQPYDPAAVPSHDGSQPAEQAPYSSPTAPPYAYGAPDAQPHHQPYVPSYGQPYDPAYFGAPQWAPPVPPPPAGPTSRRRGWTYAAGAAAVAAAVAIGVASLAHNSTTSGTAQAGGASTPSTGNNSNGGNAQFPFSAPGGTGNNTTSTGTATAKQQVGVVDIDTVVSFGQAEAAGTGLVLDSSGDILTNNHVVEGATKISVTVVATGKTYSATVVGTVPTKDIAVIRLSNASDLAVANFGDSSTVKVGDAVTGVGNAGGAGGVPSAAQGTVTALNQSITASDENGSSSEKLTGVIATNAPIQAGDSGGPLFNSSNEVIGIDTAASSQRTAGYAIPINSALALAGEIEKGVQTSSVHIGYPGFIGVTVVLTPVNGAIALQGVLAGGPAEAAGLTAGDVITAINGTRVANATQLKSAISVHKPGTRITVTYTDVSGTSHTATLTLVTGPAD